MMSCADRDNSKVPHPQASQLPFHARRSINPSLVGATEVLLNAVGDPAGPSNPPTSLSELPPGNPIALHLQQRLPSPTLLAQTALNFPQPTSSNFLPNPIPSKPARTITAPEDFSDIVISKVSELVDVLGRCSSYTGSDTSRGHKRRTTTSSFQALDSIPKPHPIDSSALGHLYGSSDWNAAASPVHSAMNAAAESQSWGSLGRQRRRRTATLSTGTSTTTSSNGASSKQTAIPTGGGAQRKRVSARIAAMAAAEKDKDGENTDSPEEEDPEAQPLPAEHPAQTVIRLHGINRQRLLKYLTRVHKVVENAYPELYESHCPKRRRKNADSSSVCTGHQQSSEYHQQSSGSEYHQQSSGSEYQEQEPLEAELLGVELDDIQPPIEEGPLTHAFPTHLTDGVSFDSDRQSWLVRLSDVPVDAEAGFRYADSYFPVRIWGNQETMYLALWVRLYAFPRQIASIPDELLEALDDLIAEKFLPSGIYVERFFDCAYPAVPENRILWPTSYEKQKLMI